MDKASGERGRESSNSTRSLIRVSGILLLTAKEYKRGSNFVLCPLSHVGHSDMCVCVSYIWKLILFNYISSKL